MPLEQIRTAAALSPSEPLRRSSLFGYASPPSPSHSDGEASDDDDGWASSRRYRAASTSHSADSMSLAKLGGVGGVTRSGSWGRNSIHGASSSGHSSASDEARPSSFKLAQSSLSSYYEGADDEERDTEDINNSKESHQAGVTSKADLKDMLDRRHSDVSNPTSLGSPRLDHDRCPIPGSSSSAVPSSSSRTSTASSAAAFSLRSISNRASTGSVSSLASSAVSRAELDPVLQGPTTESPTTLDPQPASSIPSPGNARATSTAPTTPNSAQTHSDPENDATSDITARDTETDVEPLIHRRGSSRSSSTSPIVTSNMSLRRVSKADSLGIDQLFDNSVDVALSQPASDPVGVPDSQTSLASAPRSDAAPTSPAVVPATLSPLPALLSSPPSMQPSAEELLSSPASLAYSPLLPRRHSGMFMLRSRSQLAMHPNLTMSFNGTGGGRAAARDRARKQTGWENAPFSVLEAQRHSRNMAYSQPASPGTSAVSFVWGPSGIIPGLQPAAAISDAPLSRSPQLTHRPSAQPSDAHLSDPLSLADEDAEPTTRRSPLVRQRSEYNVARPPVTRIDTTLSAQSDEAPAMTPPTSSDSSMSSFIAGSGRLGPVRSPSSSVISGPTSLMRTPTTEEWSRFLESQGVDLTGRRSRTGTSRSTGSAAHLVQRLTMSGIQSTSRTDLQTDDDSDMDSDDSDDHDLGVEVLEKLKQLGLSRAASRAGSVMGDDLGRLSEEDEENLSPASPQIDRLRALPDAAPLTPLASANRALPVSSSDPSSLTEANQNTPQASVDRGLTLRLPRSKKPTAIGEVQAGMSLYPHDFNGEKSINDFEIVSDIGRGAYGLVKKARKRGLNGRAEGEEVVIKYIIKSRILADCWRRHRTLGPIPVEIHVMDQLRRIAYMPPSRPRPWSPKRPKTIEEWRARKRDESEREATVNSGATTPSSQARSHPNICRMLDFFEDHEFYYLVMPCFGRGQDLFDFVENAPDGLDTMQCRSIFGQVADALWFLHTNNIVHRDVKDENVILDGQGNAQLIDFGSAAHVRPGKLFDTFSGTLDYAAAEILQGEKYAGQAQDIWALGVVGFVLLCGECPFWNGEEAIQGLQAGTRAAQTLEERCLLARGGRSGSMHDLDLPPLDPAWSPLKAQEGAEPDGGGRVADFADLISRCLEMDPEARPTAGQICQHRFLAGQQGWTGPLGWQRLKNDIVPLSSAVDNTTTLEP